MCCVLGIIVKQDGVENRDANVRVLVANYTTRLDYIALSLVRPHIMVSYFVDINIACWFFIIIQNNLYLSFPLLNYCLCFFMQTVP